MIRATKRIRAIVIASAALIAAAFITPAGLAPVPAASAIFLVLLLVVSRSSLTAQVGALGALRVRRRVSKPLISGKPAVMEVIIENPTNVPIEFLEIRVPYPRVFRLLEGKPVVLTTLPPKSSVTVRLKLIPRVGDHTLEPVEAVARDFLGLFRFEAKLSGADRVRVLPPVEAVHALAVTYANRPGELSRTKRRGRGVEFFGIREYVPGDEYRRIEWKASARHGLRRLFVKEFEHEVSLNIFILIDTSTYMLSGGWGRTPLEYSIKAAASIATYALRRGDSVAILHKFVSMPRLVRGRKAVNHVLETLSSVSWDAILNGGGSSIRELVSGPLMKILPRERNVIIIFTVLYGGLGEAKALVDTVSKLKALGNVVMVVVPMVEFFESRTLKGIEAAIYRLRSYGAIKSKMEGIRLLLKHGIPTVTALPEEMTDVIVARLENLRSARI